MALETVSRKNRREMKEREATEAGESRERERRTTDREICLSLCGWSDVRRQSQARVRWGGVGGDLRLFPVLGAGSAGR